MTTDVTAAELNEYIDFMYTQWLVVFCKIKSIEEVNAVADFVKWLVDKNKEIDRSDVESEVQR